MKKIGILYICTGAYDVFWEEFYKSFEKNFLPNTEKHYFVFTDAKEIYDEEKNTRIHKKHLEFEPWPLPTLLKYRTFLEYEQELSKMDYLYQSNANIICKEIVSEEEFLPVKEGEELFFNIHPGFMNKKAIYYPYDRNKKSLAYVPYNKGENYVFGAMNGGKADAFIAMMKKIENDIEMDLKKGIIAKWHDESHVNHYVATHNNYKILSPAYCYPVGFDVDFPCKIAGVSKLEKFDVNKLKGYDDNKRVYGTKQKIVDSIYHIVMVEIKLRLLLLKDIVLGKKVE